MDKLLSISGNIKLICSNRCIINDGDLEKKISEALIIILSEYNIGEVEIEFTHSDKMDDNF